MSEEADLSVVPAWVDALGCDIALQMNIRSEVKRSDSADDLIAYGDIEVGDGNEITISWGASSSDVRVLFGPFIFEEVGASVASRLTRALLTGNSRREDKGKFVHWQREVVDTDDGMYASLWVRAR